MDGTITRFGGKVMDSEGYDFLGLMTGSEGLLGVVTEVTVKILKTPEVIKAALIGFSSIEDAGNCVAQIIAKGCIPAGMEIMDKALLKATNDFCKAGYPTEAEAMMIIEFDGSEFEVESHIKTAEKIAKENNVSETAFFIKEGGGFYLRWFTPEIEMDLCGHATLATAHCIISQTNYENETILSVSYTHLTLPTNREV